MKCSGHDKIFIKTFPKALHIISVFCMLTLKTSLYGGPWGYLYFFNWRKPVVFCDKTAFSRRIHFNPVTNWKEASVQLEMINVYHCIKNAWNTIFLWTFETESIILSFWRKYSLSKPDIENALLSLFCIKFSGLPFTKEVKIFFFRIQLTRLWSCAGAKYAANFCHM